jgi:translation elongation factor EF-1beta
MAKCGLIELVDSFAFTIDTLKFAAAEQRYREFLSGVAPSDDAAMREENLRLKKQLEDLQNQVRQLTDRVTRLESTVKVSGAPTPSAPQNNAKKAEDDDDVDLFGSDDEEDAEAAKVREQRLAEYAAKKSKKPALVAKSNVILDVKPWDDETNMKELEQAVRAIEMDGLLWGASKLVPLAYGIKKLQISCVVEDDKVSIDELTEKIQENEDFVQSVDIAAFNKI